MNTMEIMSKILILIVAAWACFSAAFVIMKTAEEDSQDL